MRQPGFYQAIDTQVISSRIYRYVAVTRTYKRLRLWVILSNTHILDTVWKYSLKSVEARLITFVQLLYSLSYALDKASIAMQVETFGGVASRYEASIRFHASYDDKFVRKP